MNLTIIPKSDQDSEICVDGNCGSIPHVDTLIEKKDGRLNISFTGKSADIVANLLKKNPSSLIDKSKI